MQNLAETSRKPCGNLAETSPEPRGNLSEAFPKPLGNLSETSPKPLGNLSETSRKPLGNVGMSSLPACCPATVPQIFQLGRHAGGLTERFAGNFAEEIKPHPYARGGLPMVFPTTYLSKRMCRVVCQWFFHQLFHQKPYVWP